MVVVGVLLCCKGMGRDCMICVLNVGWKEVLLGEIWLVVIFLYGYGVNGVDFFGLVDLLLEYMFDIMFIVLDVFEVCVGVFFGF